MAAATAAINHAKHVNMAEREEYEVKKAAGLIPPKKKPVAPPLPPEKPYYGCRNQRKLYDAYHNPSVQWAIAGLIFGNFLTNIFEKEMDPHGELYPTTWLITMYTWNIIFIFELAWNFYSSAVGPFFKSGWNLFDTLVVVASLPQMAAPTTDLGPVGMLRLLRAFRVFRLFKRIK